MKNHWIKHYSKMDWQDAFQRNPEMWKARYQEIKDLLGSTWYAPNNPSNVPQMFGMAYGIGLALGLRAVVSVNN